MNNLVSKVCFVFTALVFLASLANAEPITTIETSSIELVSSSRSSRTTLDYTYKATFTNNGANASNVTGIVNSTNAAVQVIEGTVVIGDIPTNTPTTSDDTFTIRIDRTVPFNPDDLLWTFDSFKPISIDIGASEVILDEGENINQSYTVSYTAIDSTNKTIIFEQHIVPINGVQIFTDAPASWSSTITKDWIVNGNLSALAAGQYKLTTTATILETGEIASADMLVTVLPPNQLDYSLHAPLMSPGGIQLNQVEDVFFGVQLDIGNGAPESLMLEETDSNGNVIQTIGLLFDNGLDGDVVADDGMYGATFPITGNTEGKLYYRVSFFDGNQTAYSALTALAVVDFPTTTSVVDPNMLIETDDPLISVYSDHIVIIFNDDISSSDIKNIVQEVGGTIIGSIPDLNIIEVGFESKTLLELIALIEAYSLRPEVETADLSIKVDVDAVFPDDKGSLINMQVTRVDEIWLIAPSGSSIAVVDTGVDYTHTDLNVTKGEDKLSNDNDPMDANGHGTHVAGTAAAIINNNKDVAGVANGQIVAVRGIGGSMQNLADAIKYAATKSSIINISGGAYGSSKLFELLGKVFGGAFGNSNIVEKVTKGLSEKVIVAAAGNGEQGVHIGLNEKFYPCSNTNVFCVGSSTNADARSTFSNFGSWVDISAPGENVLSTKLGGGTTTLSGTSMASPLVAGVSRVVWNANPTWSASKVKKRLLDTAVEASGLKGKQIGNRIDAFEALFNGDFESKLDGWKYTGTCSSKTQLGPIIPKSGKRMAFCTTGPAGDFKQATLTKELNFVADSDFTIRFWYNFVSEEYPEFVGSIYDDSLKIKLVKPDGTEIILVQESINTTNFELVSGIDFQGGDTTVGQLKGGWREVSKTIAVKKGSGSYTIVVEDAGDDIYDTAVLLDQVRLQ